MRVFIIVLLRVAKSQSRVWTFNMISMLFPRQLQQTHDPFWVMVTAKAMISANFGYSFAKQIVTPILMIVISIPSFLKLSISLPEFNPL